MNILILSSGTRNKLVSYFIQEFKNKGKVVCTDCSELAPTLYDADKFYIVPRIDAPNYLDVILDICKKKKSKGCFPLLIQNYHLYLKINNYF